MDWHQRLVGLLGLSVLPLGLTPALRWALVAALAKDWQLALSASGAAHQKLGWLACCKNWRVASVGWRCWPRPSAHRP
jgi:hypothetical protein